MQDDQSCLGVIVLYGIATLASDWMMTPEEGSRGISTYRDDLIEFRHDILGGLRGVHVLGGVGIRLDAQTSSSRRSCVDGGRVEAEPLFPAVVGTRGIGAARRGRGGRPGMLMHGDPGR